MLTQFFMRMQKCDNTLIKIMLAIVLAGGVLFFAFSGVVDVSAQDTFGVKDFQEETLLSNVDIRIIIGRIIRAALGLLGIIAFSIIVYAGYIIMLSGGEEEKITKGKKILINAVIGLAIILSALTIVQFILNALGRATGMFGDEGGGGAPIFTQFSGSGALGDIVQDHYPYRDQTGVKRNVKIAVTFREGIDPSSVVENTNKNCLTEDGAATADRDVCVFDDEGFPTVRPYYGDCIAPDSDIEFNKRVHCDNLKVDSVEIYKSNEEGAAIAEEKVGTAVRIYYEGAGIDRVAKQFLFDPFDSLGDDLADVWYAVKLTNNIKKADGKTGAFDFTRGGEYWWKFQTDTEYDYDPPYVARVFPEQGEKIAKNVIVKIVFSEAMNPMTVQGRINDGANSFTNVIFGTTTVHGEWRIANGYRTVEFISDEACGRNSCGEPIYCLPVIPCGEDSDLCPLTPYEVLARTASSTEPASWVWAGGPLFDGVLDMYDNTLDSDPLGARNPKPQVPLDLLLIGDGERNPDNYHWSFDIENKIDRTSPYVRQIVPSADEPGVPGNADIRLTFNMEMSETSLDDGVSLEEYSNDYPDSGELGFFVRSNSTVEDRIRVTYTDLEQVRPLGPGGLDLFYFAAVSSSARGWNGFCLYPGRGPLGEACSYSESADGVVAEEGCVPVDMRDNNKDTGCAWSNAPKVFPNVDACVGILKDNSPP